MNQPNLLVSLALLSIVNSAVAVRWSNSNAPKANLTIAAVEGTSLHGSNRTLCYPLTWPSLATFYVSNFFAHIATVQSTPGDRWPLTAFDMVLALLFPTSGLMRGLNAIVRNFSSSLFARQIVAKIFSIKRWLQDETSLEKACKAGALCVVVRNPNWRPRPGQVDIPAILSSLVSDTALGQPISTEPPDFESAELVSNPSEGDDAVNALDVLAGNSPATLRPKEAVLTIYRPTWLKENQDAWWTYFDTLWGRNIVDPTLKAIHGTYKLPVGYSFSILPRDTIVRAGTRSTRDGNPECEIAASYSMLKILASIFQLLAATYTLWLHRGDQITRWGFASFSFVPVPYAIMSLVNGISHLCSSDYPAIYMVSSTVMKEAEDVGGTFYGVVGQVEPSHLTDDDTGYGSGFDSNWKGLTPGVLRRTVLSIFNSAKGRKKQVREIIVSERNLTERTQSEHENTQASAATECNGLISMSNDTVLPVLLVEQSSDIRGESYLVRAVHRSENAIESTAFRLPRVSLKWIRFGIVGIIILLCITVLNLIVHPMKTYRSIRKRAKLIVQIFLSEVRTVANDTASITAIKGLLKTRLQALLTALSANYIELSERRYGDNLPRISFKACERFQRRGDAASTSSIDTNRAKIPGFIAQAFLATIISSLSFLILGLMSNFNHGSSSKTEQVVLMMWLATGIAVGLLVPFLNINDAFTLLVRIPLEVQAAAGTQAVVLITVIFPNAQYITALIMLLVCLPWSVFVVPIWGFIIVGQQLAEWGTCVSIY